MLPATISLPIDDPFVPGFLENIIDSKVRGAALNFLQKFVDWLCSYIFFPYQSLYTAKMARVHTFSDSNVKLYDATSMGIAGIDKTIEMDFITLNNNRVFFNINPQIQTVFSRQASIDYVLIKDADACADGWYQITIQEAPRPTNPKPMETTWLVNTHQLGKIAGLAKSYLAEAP